MSNIVIAALYKFAKLPDYREMQNGLLDFCVAQGLNGTILLAAEGINGTIAGTRAGVDALMFFLRADARLAGIEHKESYSDEMPFDRMKVRLKKEIVTLGVPGVDPNEKVGTYVDAEHWNALISDPDVVLIDTRNGYEYDIGTFRGAVDPHTTTFREFPAYINKNLDPAKHKKIAMWEGECFVFDQRISVGQGLKVGTHDQCFACRHPVSQEEKASSRYQAGISCPHCFDTLPQKTRERAIERHKQNELARKRGGSHIGVPQKKQTETQSER